MKRIALVSLRLVRERAVPYRTRTIKNSETAYGLFRDMAEDLDREAMWVACLDPKQHVNCLSQVSLGTLTASPAHPREILKLVLMTSSHGFLTVHNHPSGDPTPSAEDKRVTARIKAAAELLGIRYLDHLIVGDGSYYSFADAGGL